MTLYEAARTIEASIKQLGQLQVTERVSVNNMTLVKILNMNSAKEGAQRLRAVPGLTKLAESFLSNQLVKLSVQDEFTYQDNNQASNVEKMSAQRSALMQAASTLAEYFNEVYKDKHRAVEETLVVKLLDMPKLSEVAARISELDEILRESLRIAEVGGLIERGEDIRVVSAETGSLVVWLVGEPVVAGASAAAGIKFVLWVAKQGLQLRGEWLRQRRELEGLRRLGIAGDVLESAAKVSKVAAKQYARNLTAKTKAQLPKGLDNEDEMRLERLIVGTAKLIGRQVQILEGPGTPADEEGRHLSSAEYDQLDKGIGDLLELGPGTDGEDGGEERLR